MFLTLHYVYFIIVISLITVLRHHWTKYNLLMVYYTYITDTTSSQWWSNGWWWGDRSPTWFFCSIYNNFFIYIHLYYIVNIWHIFKKNVFIFSDNNNNNQLQQMFIEYVYIIHCICILMYLTKVLDWLTIK